MAPVPEEHQGSIEIPYVEPPQAEVDPSMERIVISGMSGLFPNSKNVEDFSNLLYDKINPVTKEGTRWKYSNPELPEYFGKIMDIDKFDAQFFKVHYLLANRLDPMSRLLLEQTYQAIYDAGVNPKSLWGKKVGVYIGTSFFSETHQDHASSFNENTAWTLLGCSKNMFANRISYWLNLKSPSLCMDAACSSSLIALQRAYNAINSGECEAAIVGGSSIALHPESPIHYGRMTPLCMDGKTKSFDNNADGFARSESISILFLQKEKDAKRIYADVCYINSQFCPMTNELGHVYGLYRDQDKISNFFKEFYEKATIQPAAVEFVEAFGSAVPEADKSELEAISTVLCKDRKSPLLVGSVLSNIGYTEAASGSCSVIKVLLGYHTGKLAANLHCDNPRDDVEALKDGRMRIVTEHQNFGRSYVAVNNMSVTGLNVHLLMKGYNKPKDSLRYRANIPHIVAVSGRKETAVHKIMDHLEASPVDPEKIGLLHNIHEENISGHMARGYIILDTDEKSTTKALLQETINYDDTKRPLWFVFSGIGSQWRGMGTQLLRIPVFAAAVERCQRVLEPKSFDIVNILTSSDEKIFDNILHSFVGITAVQIGLTDVLKELQIFPDNIIGHSMGELGCAYADGCLTAEETILSAYSRGLASLQTPFIHGSMAAVGLGYKQNPVFFEEASKMIPSNAVLVEVAPHGLLQAILKRSLPSTCINIPLTRRNHSDNVIFVLAAIGKLYIHGYHPRIKQLYPKIDYPVSTGTGFLSPLVEWNHEESWDTLSRKILTKTKAAAAKFFISLYDHEHIYLKGHTHGEETLYPFSGALVCVWDTLAMSVGATRRDLSVQFKNIQLHEQPRLLQNGLLRFRVQIQKGNGYFEVRNGSMLIANGYISVEEQHDSTLFKDDIDVNSENLTLKSQDIYKIFYSRNSFYSGEFQSIQKANKDMTEAQILWTDNWVTLIDSMLQLNALRRNYDGILQPRFINKLLIDVPEHDKAIKTNTRSSDISLNAKVFALEGTTRCGGVVIKDIEFIDSPSTECEKVDLYGLKFTPFFQSNIIAVSEALNMFIQVVAENINKKIVNIVEIQSDSFSLQKEIHELIDENPGLVINLKIVRVENIANDDNKILLNTADLVLARNINTSDKKCKLIYDAVPKDIFMLVTGDSSITSLPQALCRAVASAITPRGKLVLTRWHPAPKPHASTAISINNASDFRLLHSTMASLTLNQYLFVLCCYPQPYGLKELVQTLRKEYKCAKVFIIAMSDQTNKKDKFFEQLPEFDLVFNKYNDGTWGGEYYFKSEKRSASMEQTVTLQSYKLGDLDSLRWEEGFALEANKIAVKVHYAGLNVRDAKRACASIPCRLEDNTDIGYGYGMDFSGITESGERVMGVIRGGAASSRVAAEPSMLWPVPAHWTLEDAATVPLPYVHAFYCLGIKTTMLPTTRLLVHGATGALGLAIISIALAHGCQVFATVNDVKKKRFMRNMFPNLPDDHIGNSRHESFGDMVLHKTKGLGCNIIICCLEGDLRNVALKCSGDFGITLDTQPMSCQEYYQFGMNSIEKERSYVLLDLSSIFRTRNEKDMKDLQLMVCEGIKRGYVRPLPRITYEAPEAAHALRLLAASRHRGRALLRLGDMSLPVAPRLVISPYGGHLVLSATNDDILVGKVIDVLIERGAKNIVINLQEAVPYEYIKTQFKKWQKLGAQVTLSTVKIENAYNMEIVVRDCNMLAPVEAVYLIASHADHHDKTQEKIKSVISDLDLVTRMSCPTIKLFALVNEESNIGQDVCIKRTMDGLSSIVLNLPKLIKFGDGTSKADRGLSYKAAVQAIERAMCSSSCAVFLAQKEQQIFKYKLIKDIASIAGININESTPGSEPLENLGVNISTCNTISELIEEQLGLKISKEDIPKLTIKRICSMESYLKAEKHKIKGLNVILNYIDHDVILATHDLISLPTATNCTVDLVEVTDTQETYMIILPGLEGHHSKFFSLCECLKLPAVVLQPGFDYPNETVEEIAARLIKIVFKKIQPKKTFYLLGYSFGVLVALEMAAILEEQGLEGVVFCVDASPDTFPAALDSWLSEEGATDETRLQDAIVQHMYALMASGTSQSLHLELHEASNWPQKVEAGVRALRDQIPLPSQYTRAIIATTYSRIEQARRYEAQRLRANPLRSLLVVLRSSSHPTSVEPDLSLSRYTVRVPQVYYLNVDHARILEELRCANFVNQHLGKDILDAFQNRNICETY